MSFTREIKREIVKRSPQTREEGIALLCGVLDTSGKYFPDGGFSFTGENESTARRLLALVEGLFGEQMTLTEAAYDPKHGRDKLTFFLPGDHGAELKEFSQTEADPACALAYLKGAFLGGGSCTLPHEGKKTGYHLEFAFFSQEKAEGFRILLDGLGFVSGSMPRAERAVVYIKSREAISDFLSVVGAESSLGKFDEVSAQREANNAENRVINCSSGNADRAAIASVEQVRAISALMRTDRFKDLPAPLRETAEARLAHPELSLNELAEAIGMTKSGLYHRLRKLMEICRR